MDEPISEQNSWTARESSIERYLRELQQKIVAVFESVEGTNGSFKKDVWERKEGGGGITCVLQGGTVFEKFGVGFSVLRVLHCLSLPPLGVRGSGDNLFVRWGSPLWLIPTPRRFPLFI